MKNNPKKDKHLPISGVHGDFEVGMTGGRVKTWLILGLWSCAHGKVTSDENGCKD